MVMTDFAELFKKIIQLRLEQEYFQQRKGKKLIDFVGTKWSIRNVDIYIYIEQSRRRVKTSTNILCTTVIFILGWSTETLIIRSLPTFPF